MRVVDASLVISVLLPEEDSDAARALIASETCLAPDLIVNECTNALWRSVRVGRILDSEAEQAMRVFSNLGLVLASSSDFAERALALAISLDHPAYDCFYIAHAESLGVPFLTADKKLITKVRASSATTVEIISLEDFAQANDL